MKRSILLMRLLVGVIIALAVGLMALVSYSYLTNSFSGRGQIVLLEGTGVFWEADREPQAREESPALGYLAPNFTLFDLDGRAVTLSELRGVPVLLNFWASWCPPCRKEMPDLQAFQEQYGDQVTVLGINWAEDPQTVRDFLDRYGITYTNVLDRQGKAFVSYRLTGIPTSFFLDEEGFIRGVWLGPLKTDEIAENFAKITTIFRIRGGAAEEEP
jgi:thiol-disulfide isomerase/thioredoxin